jgi:hypothetical protein
MTITNAYRIAQWISLSQLPTNYDGDIFLLSKGELKNISEYLDYWRQSLQKSRKILHEDSHDCTDFSSWKTENDQRNSYQNSSYKSKKKK